MKRRWMLALVVVAGCGSIKGMMSEVKDARVECASCQAGMAVAVGVPLKLKVAWKRCDSRDQRCEPDKPPFSIAVTCEGAHCDLVDTGDGDLEVTLAEPGTATLVVRLADQKQREVRLGPVTAVALDGIDLICTFLPRGADGTSKREPCGTAVPAGSDVHVEIVARGTGGRRLASPIPRDVAVDGRPVLVDGSAAGDGSWACKESIDSSDPSVATVRKCVRHDVPAGASWTLEARLPGEKLVSQLKITVAKR